METFSNYIAKAQAAITAKYPTAKNLQLVNGEYRPNIDNFHYEYNFTSSTVSYKVVVNTFEAEANFLVFPVPPIVGLGAIELPLQLDLQAAYDMARDMGHKPNLMDGIVFLQTDPHIGNYPMYWFLNGNSDTEWIQVNEYQPHIVRTTKTQPMQPA